MEVQDCFNRPPDTLEEVLHYVVSLTIYCKYGYKDMNGKICYRFNFNMEQAHSLYYHKISSSNVIDRLKLLMKRKEGYANSKTYTVNELALFTLIHTGLLGRRLVGSLYGLSRETVRYKYSNMLKYNGFERLNGRCKERFRNARINNE